MKIVVIGSGFGGLSAAVRLQAQGHAVTIVEKLDKAGGRAYVFERDGFKFDAGPTIITAPWMIDDIFAAAGKKTADYVQIVPIDPFYNVRFEDGSVFHYNGEREQVLSEIRRFNADNIAGYERFFAETEKVFAAGMSLVDQPFSTVGSMLKVAPKLAMLQAQRSVATFVNKYIIGSRDCSRCSAFIRCSSVAIPSSRAACTRWCIPSSRSGACTLQWVALGRWCVAWWTASQASAAHSGSTPRSRRLRSMPRVAGRLPSCSLLVNASAPMRWCVTGMWPTVT
ncbi:MAG: FAD-dependent oxidoreductase [Gemmatimonadaceae bacterium]|nr:FAD-dependent oxidoreductase [Gemmatimonadaceae bacterium]